VEAYSVINAEYPTCLDYRLKDGGEVGITHRRRSTPQKLFKFLSLILNYLIGSRTRDLPACGVLLQPLRYRLAGGGKTLDQLREASFSERTITHALMQEAIPH
jgi:hypothetical protein